MSEADSLPDLLNLPGLTVARVAETESQYTVLVETTNPRPEPCCLLQPTALRRNGTKRQVFRDLPAHGKFVDVQIDRQRFHCKECGKTVYEAVPQLDGAHRMTKRLAETLARQAIQRTFAEVGRDTGLSEGTVRAVFRNRVDQMLAARNVETPRVLGMDEKFLLGGYRCVIGNIEEKTLLDILPSRFKQPLDAYMDALPNREAVEVVCQDMWPTYRAVARKHFPRAQIVVDKFHVVKLAMEAVERIRRRMNRDLDATTRKRLKQQRTLMLMRFHRADQRARERLQEWLDRLPGLADAYWAKERFFDIYECADGAEAQRAYREWEASVPPAFKADFATIPTAMRTWSGHIFSYFDHRYTNAYVEGVNRLIGDLERDGRGYSFDVLRAKALLAYGHQTRSTPRFIREALAGRYTSGPIPTVNYGVDLERLLATLETANYETRFQDGRWVERRMPSGLSTLKTLGFDMPAEG